MTTRTTGRRTPGSRPRITLRGAESLRRVLGASAASRVTLERLLLAALTHGDPTRLPHFSGGPPLLRLPDVTLPTLGRRRTVSVAAMALVPLSVIAMPAGPGTGSTTNGLTPAASAVRGAAELPTDQPAPTEGGRAAWGADRDGLASMADRRAVVPELDLDDFGPLENEAGAAGSVFTQPGQSASTIPVPEPEQLPEPDEGFPEEYVERVAALADVHGLEYDDTIGEEHVRQVAEAYGREIGDEFEEVDIRWLESHHRAKQAELLRELGVDFGEWVGENDIAEAGALVGVAVDEPVTAHDVEAVRRGAEEVLEERRPTPVFATVGAVRFRVPSRDLHLIGFHEAAMRGALRMGPQENAPMRTLPTRNRRTPTRSAADISVETGTPVLSPVSGTVVGIQRYALYGKYPDLRIQIVPAGDRSKLVTVLHVTGATVRIGDRVASGETVIARRATKFPFRSQIDRFAGDHPHVHVEIRNR